MRKILFAILCMISVHAYGASGTTYIPQFYPLDASKIQGNGQGVTANPSVNSTTNIDLAIADDDIMTGAEVITSGSTPGDYIVLQVLISGVVVGTPIPGPWYVQSTGFEDSELIIPQKLTSGMTLRVVYHNTSLVAVPFIAVNYKLWKVLI